MENKHTCQELKDAKTKKIPVEVKIRLEQCGLVVKYFCRVITLLIMVQRTWVQIPGSRKFIGREKIFVLSDKVKDLNKEVRPSLIEVLHANC